MGAVPAAHHTRSAAVQARALGIAARRLASSRSPLETTKGWPEAISGRADR